MSSQLKSTFLKYPLFLVLLTFSSHFSVYSQTFSLKVNLSVAQQIKANFKSSGRLYMFITTDSTSEPVHNVWPNFYTKSDYVFAKNFEWNAGQILKIHDDKGWDCWNRNGITSLKKLPANTYYIQFLWQQNFEGFAVTDEQNLRSQKIKIELNSSQTIDATLTELNQRWNLKEHPHIKYEKIKSDTLSSWHSKTIYEHVGVLLPSHYFEHPNKEYPIYYYIGGGDSDCRYLSLTMDLSKEFAEWWMSDDAPQIIIVYLDGTQNRNFYHLDSDNLGPHGASLINEVIPFIEKKYRGTTSATTRFIGGCSTGGYGSLALQLFYPTMFNGVYSYSPDPISFTNCLYTDIYKESNYFYDTYGYTKMFNELGRTNRPISVKDWVSFENVLGKSGTYLDANHGSAVSALTFSPKGENGLPLPMFDAVTGEIDHAVVTHWSNYDLNLYIANNWDKIGTDLTGKIYISSNERDDYFLDGAVRVFENTLSNLSEPLPNATIEWVPGNGHCHAYKIGAPHMMVLQMIEERIGKMQ